VQIKKQPIISAFGLEYKTHGFPAIQIIPKNRLRKNLLKEFIAGFSKKVQNGKGS
jgi:hypothetical protein